MKMRKSITCGIITMGIVGMAIGMIGCGKTEENSTGKTEDKVTISFWHK